MLTSFYYFLLIRVLAFTSSKHYLYRLTFYYTFLTALPGLHLGGHRPVYLLFDL